MNHRMYWAKACVIAQAQSKVSRGSIIAWQVNAHRWKMYWSWQYAHMHTLLFKCVSKTKDVWLWNVDNVSIWNRLSRCLVDFFYALSDISDELNVGKIWNANHHSYDNLQVNELVALLRAPPSWLPVWFYFHWWYGTEIEWIIYSLFIFE